MAVSVLGNAGIEWQLVAVCIAGIIAFTLLLEVSKEKLEHYIKMHYPPHFFSMLQQVYHEVMLLGIISYALFMLEQLEAFNLKDGNQLAWVVGFEFSHVLLFWMALLFIFKSFAVMVICTKSSREWDKRERVPFSTSLERWKAECSPGQRRGLLSRMLTNVRGVRGICIFMRSLEPMCVVNVATNTLGVGPLWHGIAGAA
eukprot:COSAG01_NODE_287_length_19408_cov_231.791703_11_plen_200_part_00